MIRRVELLEQGDLVFDDSKLSKTVQLTKKIGAEWNGLDERTKAKFKLPQEV